MPSQKVVEASNSQYAPKYVPTAVFVGGTSGIGKSMAESFAKQTNGHANIIIVGRNKAAGDALISTFPSPPHHDVKHEFVSCDAQEMKNVHETNQILISRLEKINFLVLSPGGMGFSRQDTTEGNDVSLSLRVYCRAKFITELMPLLEKAKAAGEDARVMSILAAAKGGSPDLQDLGLKNWGFVRAMVATGTYNDSMVKELSKQHPDLTFIHIYPGIVDTPAMRPNWWMSAITTIIKPFAVIAPDVCARYMLYPLLNPEFASGAYWLDSKANKLNLPANLTDDVTSQVWQHLLDVTKTK